MGKDYFSRRILPGLFLVLSSVLVACFGSTKWTTICVWGGSSSTCSLVTNILWRLFALTHSRARCTHRAWPLCTRRAKNTINSARWPQAHRRRPLVRPPPFINASDSCSHCCQYYCDLLPVRTIDFPIFYCSNALWPSNLPLLRYAKLWCFAPHIRSHSLAAAANTTTCECARANIFAGAFTH